MATLQTDLRVSKMVQRQHHILRLPEIKRRTGLGRSTIYLHISKGSFPTPINLGDRAVGWLEEDINNWLDKKIEQSRKVKGWKS